MMTICGEFRWRDEQVAQMKYGADVRDLVSSTAASYSKRLEMERLRAERTIQDLRRKEQYVLHAPG